MQQDPSTTPEPQTAPRPDEATASDEGSGANLEERLRAAEQRAEEHREAWLRAKAETENVRKRGATEAAQTRKYAVESFCNELLAVKDSLEGALAVEHATVESYRSGVDLTLRQLRSVFEKFSVLEINPLNEKFDPHRHQAIAAIESDAEPNTVVSVLQKGYALADRVLRPAMVTVSKGRES